MKKSILLIVITLFVSKLNAQLLDSIYANQKKGISYNHQSINRFFYDTQTNGSNIPKDRWSGGIHSRGRILNGIYVNYRYNTTAKKGLYFAYENPRIGDLIIGAYNQYFAENNDLYGLSDFAYNKIVTSGYLGELNYGRNILVNKSKTLVLSTGIYLGDMILPNDYFGLGGYHLIGGVFANMDKVIGQNLVLRISPAYARDFLWFGGSLKEYVNPRIFKIDTEIIHKKGLYFGLSYRLTDGDSDRKSLKIGYRFNIIGRE